MLPQGSALEQFLRKVFIAARERTAVKYEKTRGVYFSLSKTSGFVVFICWVFGGYLAAAGGPSL